MAAGFETTGSPLDRSRPARRDVRVMLKHSNKTGMVVESPLYSLSILSQSSNRKFCFMLPFLQHRGLYDVHTSEEKMRTPPIANTCQIVAADKQFGLI